MRVQKIFGVEWKNKFDLSKKVFSEEIFPLLVNGPRDLLILLNKAEDNRTKSKITTDDLSEVAHFLRDEKYNEISRLYGGTYDGIDAFCREAINVVKTMQAPLSTKLVDDTLNGSISDPEAPLHELRKKYDWIVNVQSGVPRASMILGALGAFAFISKGIKHFPWEGHSLDELDNSDEIELTPLFSG